MAAVMEHAAETDDKRAFSEQELVSKLTTENKVSIYNGRSSGMTFFFTCNIKWLLNLPGAFSNSIEVPDMATNFL